MKAKNRLATLAIAAIFSTAPNVHAFYDPTIGRWANRDPVEERGGADLYEFVGNDAVNHVDPFGMVIGNFSVLISKPARRFQVAGWSTRFRWSPRSSWSTKCAPCDEGVWIQNYSIEAQTWLGTTKVGPKKDWDETSYQGNSDLWVNGAYPRGSRSDSADMWDDPQIAPLYNLYLYRFRATSCFKCTKGSDAGRIYGCYDWGFTYNSDARPDVFGGVFAGPYRYNEIAGQ